MPQPTLALESSPRVGRTPRLADPNEIYLRVQLRTNNSTTVVVVDPKLKCRDILGLVCQKKVLFPERQQMLILYGDGRPEELVADMEKSLSDYQGVDGIVVEEKPGLEQLGPRNQPFMRTGRRTSVISAPSAKQTNVRVSPQEFPKTLVDQSDLRMMLANLQRQAEFSNGGSRHLNNGSHGAGSGALGMAKRKHMKSLSMLLFKRPSENSMNLGAPASPSSPVSDQTLENPGTSATSKPGIDSQPVSRGDSFLSTESLVTAEGSETASDTQQNDQKTDETSDGVEVSPGGIKAEDGEHQLKQEPEQEKPQQQSEIQPQTQKKDVTEDQVPSVTLVSRPIISQTLVEEDQTAADETDGKTKQGAEKDEGKAPQPEPNELSSPPSTNLLQSPLTTSPTSDIGHIDSPVSPTTAAIPTVPGSILDIQTSPKLSTRRSVVSFKDLSISASSTARSSLTSISVSTPVSATASDPPTAAHHAHSSALTISSHIHDSSSPGDSYPTSESDLADDAAEATAEATESESAHSGSMMMTRSNSTGADRGHGFVRKRTISTPATSTGHTSHGYSTTTLKKHHLQKNRRRSQSEIGLGEHDASERASVVDAMIPSSHLPTVPGIMLKVDLPDSQSTTIKLPPDVTMETVLLQICHKRSLDFETHTLEAGGAQKFIPMELDRTLGYYHNECRLNSVAVVRDKKMYSTMCVSEGDQDVMILQSVLGRFQVMAATIEKLIERLTDDQEADNSFMDTLLLTYRSFLKPEDFFDHLVARFNCELPENPTDEDVAYFNMMRVPVKKRVIFTLKFWVEHHWHDFGVNSALRHDLEYFATQVADGSETELKDLAQEVLTGIEVHSKQYEDLINSYRAVERRGKTMQSMFMELTPEDLGKQLCIHNFKLFRNIHPMEFLNQIWKYSDEASPLLDYFIQRFDTESYWVATEIVSIKDIKKRASVLKKFIFTAKACLEYHNFFSMFALIAGLNLSPVQRLKKTWGALSDRTKKAFSELETLCDPSRNMKNYRDRLAKCIPPIVPFLPIYLKDLTFMNDGNQSTIRNMINFDKLRMMGNRVRDITALAAVEYQFQPNPAIQNYLAKPPTEKDLAKLKEMSIECER
ncbi:hypothetical protein HK102_006959 [Quaeritorhiza haematococci]|nr:hypothetical protein HK102_006959 [Quaeritorhiza haematococci]